jgi:tetratricopeptide (TPR) repeat protein
VNARLKAALGLALALGSLSIATTSTYAADKKPKTKVTGTIKDLDSREITVLPDPPSNVKPAQAMEQYQKYLELPPSGDERIRAEAMRRLGDLQLEADEAKAGTEATLSGPELKEAIKLYEKRLAAYPDNPGNDRVLYQLSRAYEANSQPEKALAVLDKLVAKFPNSLWDTEAQFRRGEILFSAARYKDAEPAYAKVIAAGKDSGFYQQGLYKHGWSLFKQSRGEESVVSFLKVVDSVLVVEGQLRERDSLARPERELSDDAFRAIAITYYDLDGAETLDAALKQRGDPVYAHLLYENLGNLYMEKERYQDAALAYEAFAKRRPDDRFAPSLQVKTIEAYQKGGLTALVLEGKESFIERYAFGSAFWQHRRAEDAPEVVAQLKANQKDVAEYHHAQAQKTKKPEEYAAAARWYNAMLESFPQDAQAPATRYLLAEVLFESGQYADAAKEYERTAYDYPAHAKSADAAYAAVVAYQKQEPLLQGDARTAWRRKGIESSLMFATSYPEHPESAKALTKADEDLFALNEFDRVIEVSNTILERKPAVDQKQQRTATTLLAHSLFDRGRFAEAEQAYLRVQGYLAAKDPDRTAISDRIAASIYKQAEAKQASGDPSAVEDFLRVGALAPTSKVGVNAEYDAAGILIRNKQWDRAAKVLEGFRAKYPNSELMPDVTRSLAVAYGETGRAGEAAAEYERIAASPKEQPEVKREALLQAATLYEKSKSTANMSRVYATYIKQYPRPLDQAQEARQKLADMAKQQGERKVRDQWLTEIIGADKAAGAARTDRSKYLAARGTLEQVEPDVAAFNSIKLVVPLDKSLKAKKKALDKVLSSYSHALDYGVAEVTTASTFGMAELYRQLGADLIASERPKGLDAEAKEQYDVLLEEQAFPFEEKSIELHEVNAQRASSGVYDESVRRSFEVLAKLKPARYAKAEISEEYVPTLR